jgi:hypothetical protein
MVSFFDMFWLWCAAAGAGIGTIFFHEKLGVSGFWGGAIGGVIGAFCGCVLTGWFRRWAKRSEKRKRSVMTTEQLIKELYDPTRFYCWITSPCLGELKSRGEDIQKHRELLMTMMESDHYMQREIGFRAFLEFFPEQAQPLQGYYPLGHDAENLKACRTRVAALRQSLKR